MEAALAANPPMVHHPGATTIPMPKVPFLDFFLNRTQHEATSTALICQSTMQCSPGAA